MFLFLLLLLHTLLPLRLLCTRLCISLGTRFLLLEYAQFHFNVICCMGAWQGSIFLNLNHTPLSDQVAEDFASSNEQEKAIEFPYSLGFACMRGRLVPDALFQAHGNLPRLRFEVVM